MASKHFCKACLRALEQSNARGLSQFALRNGRRWPSPAARPLITSSIRSFASQVDPKPTRYTPSAATQESSTPPTSSQAYSEDAQPGIEPSTASMAQQIRNNIDSGLTGSYVAFGATEQMFKLCAAQADYDIPQAREKNGIIPKTEAEEDLGVGTGWWYDALGLTPTFNTWAQITFLHMYIITTRLRRIPPEQAQIWHQQLHDHFFYFCEDRMAVMHQMVARSVRQKYLKDLFVQWRGVVIGYDEGLIKGDAVLASAIWRNIFKASEETDVEKLALVTSYVRRAIMEIERLPEENFLTGAFSFGSPESERAIVSKESPKVKEILGDEQASP